MAALMPEVLCTRPEEEYFFVEGCHILELSNREQDPGLSIARARVAPGATTHWHRLRDTVERYLILEGSGLVELGAMAPRPVGPGDTVIIPALCPQRITNTGTSELVFLALCTPRFTPSSYEDLEIRDLEIRDLETRDLEIGNLETGDDPGQ